MRANVLQDTGQLLNKLEVIINFFQLYGLILTLDITIEWPQLWLDVSVFYNWIPNFFSVDFDSIFTTLNLDIPHGIRDVPPHPLTPPMHCRCPSSPP